MKAIAVLVEGQTEERFVRQVLGPHLGDDVYVQPIVVATSRTPTGHKRRGGGGTWKHYAADLESLLRQPHWFRVGLLVDFYAYPRDAPYFEKSGDAHTRHTSLLQGLRRTYPDPRFTPGIALHEFETWVNGPTTAPSKRVLDAWPGYVKERDGVAAIQEAGFETILALCPTFDPGSRN